MPSGIFSPDQIEQLAENYFRDTLRNLEIKRGTGEGVPVGPGELRYRLKEQEDTLKRQ